MAKLLMSVLVAFFATVSGFMLLSSSSGAATATTTATESHSKPQKHLKAFSSEADLKAFFKKLRNGRGRGYGSANTAVTSTDAAPMPMEMSKSEAKPAIAGASPAKDDKESITNTQTAGVDEGGIVKMYGDYLVVLRRGRLFTVSIAENSLKPISSIDAYGPDIDPSGTWYDEMLISDNNIVVVGYSYERGGTELGLFRIDREGGLKYRATYHMRANDYYSSRNYASRLIGDKLIFYSPLYLDLYGNDPEDSFPAVRKWHKGAKPSEFKRIITANRNYRVDQNDETVNDLAMHTVTTCDLSMPDMTCDATAVLGPEGNVFYVSQKSVYVWASTWNYGNERQSSRSLLFKMPLSTGDPTALRVSGSPVDQFSFLEDENEGLNVLVRAESNGDGMWSSEVTSGETALLRVTSDMFTDGGTSAPQASYRELQRVQGYTFQNRFVGDYLLYGTGNSWSTPKDKRGNQLYVVNWKTGAQTTVPIEHTVDRLDALASDGIVVGTRGNDLYFTSVRLDNMPRVIDSYSIKNATQGETRSQGFFYKRETEDSGMLGLPITSNGRPGYAQLSQGSAGIVFLRNDALRFSELGRLRSALIANINDNCKASCVDWYGNARPIFARGRIFGLMGYEIVEGTLRSGQIAEVRRVDFSPSRAYVGSR
jgi:hypothetical protein